MILLGSIVNGITVVLAGLIGSKLGKALPRRVSQTLLQAMALCVFYIGMEGAISSGSGIRYAALGAIISLAIGTAIGELIDIDKWLNRLAAWLQSKVKTAEGEGSIAAGFVNASLLICVGAWAITGAMEGGMNNSHASLISKAVIDFVSCFVLAGSLGVGVAFAGVAVFLYQGALAVCAYALGGLLTAPLIGAMGCVGSILILGVSLNMMGLTKIRVVNCIPAILVAIPVQMLLELPV